MSSVVVSTSAATGRPFVFDDNPDLHVGTAAPSTSSGQAFGYPVERSSTARREHLQSTINNQKIRPSSITPASQLEIRPTPEMVSSGIPAIDALIGGLPRGCLTEICGPASSGRTTFLLAALSAATRRGEFCAVVDASDALDPHSATASGVALDRLLWVRCGEDPPQKSPAKQKGWPISCASLAREVGSFSQSASNFDRTSSRQSERRLEQVLRATDLLLESGGFGLIVLDLADLPPQTARRIPLTTWFRFRRAIEHTPTILLAIEPQPIAGSCSSLLLQLSPPDNEQEASFARDGSLFDAGESAAERRKSAAHGASRGLGAESNKAPEAQKKNCRCEQSVLDFQIVNPAHAQLLTGLNIVAELIRSRLERKPARSVTFATKTAWAG
jgi:hypothetical protein